MNCSIHHQLSISAQAAVLEDMYIGVNHHEHPTKTSTFDKNEQKQKTVAAEEQNTTAAATAQYHRTPADQPTLQHDPSLDHGDLDLTNHGDVISIQGPIHKGPRTMLIVHTTL